MFYTRIRYSKDGRRNYSNWRTKPLGTTGDFRRRVECRQFGRGRAFVFEELVTDDCRADLIAASVQRNGNARFEPAPVIGGAYSDDVRPWAAQDCVNRIPVPAERGGTRSEGILRDRPGYATFSIIGDNAYLRGLHNCEGRLLAVAGGSLFQVAVTGATTSLGSIPGVGRVVMAHNQVGEGNEVVIGNGMSGYVYNTVSGVLAQITDPAFPGFKSLDFVDGYIAGVEPGGKYWFISDLAGAMNYNSLDRQDAETQPDKIVGLIVSKREVLVFGERTAQFFRNTGAGTGTFKNVNGTEMDVGAASPHAISRVDQTVLWVGSDGSGYMLEGNLPKRITTHAIEQAWGRCNLSACTATTYDHLGHKLWIVTMTDGQTWCFDLSTGEWFRFKSYGMDFWRISHLVKWNGALIGGDFTNGRLYQFSQYLSNDDGEPMERSRAFGVMHDNENDVFLDAIALVYNTGMTAGSPPLPQPMIGVVSVTGDLQDAVVADSGTYQYGSAGGLLPHTFSILSGSLPAGATMSDTGLVTYTYTTADTYSWVVRVTDANGNPAYLSDTATITSNVGYFDLNAVTNGGVSPAVGITINVPPGETLTINMPDGRLYTAWVYQGLGVPEPYRTTFVVTDASAVSTTYFDDTYTTAAAALDAAQAGMPLVLSGSASYTFWIPDPAAYDNSGGLSFAYTVA